MPDIVHEYDIASFGLGDTVYGETYADVIKEGVITKLDLECVNKQRFQIRDAQGFHHWLRIVNLIEKNAETHA